MKKVLTDRTDRQTNEQSERETERIPDRHNNERVMVKALTDKTDRQTNEQSERETDRIPDRHNNERVMVRISSQTREELNLDYHLMTFLSNIHLRVFEAASLVSI